MGEDSLTEVNAETAEKQKATGELVLGLSKLLKLNAKDLQEGYPDDVREQRFHLVYSSMYTYLKRVNLTYQWLLTQPVF